MSAFDPAAAEGFVKEHPVGVAVGALAIVLVIWYLIAAGGSSQNVSAAPASNDDTATESAAAIQAAQVTANAQTAAATIAAGVTNNQTAAAQTVALATLQGTNDANAAAATASVANSYYGAASEIADSNAATATAAYSAAVGISANNSAVAISGNQAVAAEQEAQDTLLSSQFSNLADVLKSFGLNVQSITNNTNATQVGLGGLINAGNANGGVQPLLPIPAGGAAGQGSPFDAITSALVWQSGVDSTMATNTAILGQNAAVVAADQAGLAATANFAGNTSNTIAATAANGIANISSWLNNLFGSYGQTVAASAPKTPAVNTANTISQNNGLLTNIQSTLSGIISSSNTALAGGPGLVQPGSITVATHD